ncbi:DNA cytosine methyltransferase [Thalassotalea euphylliae]|uniref:DNA cytosine methyltransferase n=1 Tax=Thalassotalea euphylliae TaxID=1655234 RepID=UPI003626DEEA
MNYIELFAGCGGLSLGLESIDGANMIMANELSPMPAQTFAYNFFNEDLEVDGLIPERIKWLSSQYSVSNLKLRLREDPRTYPELNSSNHHTDIVDDNLNGKLVVANIIHLNQFLRSNPDITEQLANAYGQGSLDFVSGGPPCQSFSMAGLRNRDCDKNSLPWEFAQFVNQVRPKFAILENVTGILRAFEQDGEKYHAWVEVSKAFSEIGYVPLCLHVNARFAGVPQNRPRFIMIAVRHDIYEQLAPTFNDAEQRLFESSLEFFQSVQDGNNPGIELLNYHDVVNESDLELFTNSFLANVVIAPVEHVTVAEAIDDLRFNGELAEPSEHVLNTAEILGHGNLINRDALTNHEERANGELVQRRFRLYQVMQQVGNGLAKEVRSVLRGALGIISDEAWNAFREHDYLIEDGTYIQFETKREFLDFLSRHMTKKQTQKALDAHSPAPAALSIPDDACHYHHDELRTLTVREMARIQSFPDSFVFRSKVTTGGQMRKFEVPQYTQVGNAVPPLLGRALGLSIQNLLNRL